MSPDVDYRPVPGIEGLLIGSDRSAWSHILQARRWHRLKPVVRPGRSDAIVVKRHGRAIWLSLDAIHTAAFPPGALDRTPAAVRGSDNGAAVLDEAAAAEMRRLRRSEPAHWTYRALARRFGVSRSTVYHVLSGRTWGHVGTPAVADTTVPGPMAGPPV
jgi:hypothetical protein